MQDVQADIEVMNELFEQRKENLGRFASLLNILLILTAFYFTIISFTLEAIGKNGTTLTTVASGIIRNPNIILCFFFIVLTFVAIVLNMVHAFSYNKVIKKAGSVQFIENNELPQYNMKLFSAIKVQGISYAFASGSIMFSFFSLCNYFLNESGFFWFLLVLLIIDCVFFIMLSFLILSD
ncbi:hypothetical protein ACSAZK_14470 [Methanosarcina sp. Mfa9]|uniref:hypothetical protein n=1 Tax=Methanosarcina sp. Mfa9 TaxID=3439063 RepID=UPI003F8746B0